MEKGYFFCGDFLGFSNMVEGLDPVSLNRKTNEIIELVREAARESHIDRWQLMSDTVFAAVGDSLLEFKKIIIFSRKLLEKGISKSLPMRGGISYGEFCWNSNLTYGQAVIDSHKLETSQEWIGVALSISVPSFKEEQYTEIGLICYPAPMKSSSIYFLLNVVSWDIPSCKKLFALCCTDGLLGHSGKPVNPSSLSKIQNTIIFSWYQSLVKKDLKALHLFHGGALPMQLISEHFESP